MSISSYTSITASWPAGTRTHKPMDEVFSEVTLSDGRVVAAWDGETAWSEHVLDEVIELFGCRLDAVAGLELHCHYETTCVDEGFFGCDLTIEDGVCKYEESDIVYREKSMRDCPISIHEPDLEANEDKEGFVNALNEALIKHGNGRYDHLMDHPVRYEESNGIEVMGLRGRWVDITCDSLTSIMHEFMEIVR